MPKKIANPPLVRGSLRPTVSLRLRAGITTRAAMHAFDSWRQPAWREEDETRHAPPRATNACRRKCTYNSGRNLKMCVCLFIFGLPRTYIICMPHTKKRHVDGGFCSRRRHGIELEEKHYSKRIHHLLCALLVGSLRKSERKREINDGSARGGPVVFLLFLKRHKPGFLVLESEARLPRARWLLAPTAPYIYHALILRTKGHTGRA